MQLNYRGYTVEIDVGKWKALPFKEKIQCIYEYISSEISYKAEKLKDYWIGYVNVSVQDIWCMNENGSFDDKVYKVNAVAGRFGHGQFLTDIPQETCQQMIDEWEHSEKKVFNLHLGNSFMYQEYDFSRKQKDMLIEQLKPIMEREWYIDEDYCADEWQ